MTPFVNFLTAFIMSFAGSIPPGTINLSVVQMGLEGRLKAAYRFSLTASLIEYPYAWIAVKFQKLITASPAITENLTILSALVLIVLGAINVWPRKKSDAAEAGALSRGGYRKGILLGILNPLAIPYWIGISAYLESQGWVELSSPPRLHSFLAGVVAGAFVLLVLLAHLSSRIMTGLIRFPWVRQIPGMLLLCLGIYALVEHFFF